MQMDGFNLEDMPKLPRNARYVLHKNECFDWGTFGWAIRENIVNVKQYKYIIFMNSSVRGPFLPPYWTVKTPWLPTEANFRALILPIRRRPTCARTVCGILCQPEHLSGPDASKFSRV
jgi:hypothetical protein